MRLLPRTEIVCQQLVELLTAYLDGALPRRLHKAVERHLMKCVHCTEYVAQFKRTIELSGSVPHEDLPDELLAALERALDEYR